MSPIHTFWSTLATPVSILPVVPNPCGHWKGFTTRPYMWVLNNPQGLLLLLP